MLIRQPHHIHNLLTKPINGKPSRRSGFTLVELSIVLVIIGLLIGGILVGQSLIESAKMNRFVRQIQQYDIAITVFKQKFASLPGDSVLLTQKGDNDGVVLGNMHSNTDSSKVWTHLSETGMINDVYTNAGNCICAGQKNPIAEYVEGDRGVIFGSIPTLNKHFYTLMRNTSWNDKPNNDIYVKEAHSVDNKIDDGNGATGIFVIRDLTGYNSGLTEAGRGGIHCVNSNGDYRLNNFGLRRCAVRIEANIE